MNILKTSAIAMALMTGAMLSSPAIADDVSAAAAAAMHETTSGSAPMIQAEKDGLRITFAYGRATTKAMQESAVYLTIENTGDADDRLVSASSPVARQVQIHDIAMTDGVMTMFERTEGVIIPAGGKAELAQGGKHIMLMGLNHQLKQGETIPLTLTFEHAGELSLKAGVMPLTYMPGDMHQGHDAH